MKQRFKTLSYLFLKNVMFILERPKYRTSYKRSIYLIESKQFHNWIISSSKLKTPSTAHRSKESFVIANKSEIYKKGIPTTLFLQFKSDKIIGRELVAIQEYLLCQCIVTEPLGRAEYKLLSTENTIVKQMPSTEQGDSIWLKLSMKRFECLQNEKIIEETYKPTSDISFLGNHWPIIGTVSVN